MNNKIKKTLGQGKRQNPKTLSFFAPSILVFGDLPFLTRRRRMKKTWVETSRGRFVLKTGTITPYGFVNVKRTDRFTDLKEANKKAELCNYIWEKCQEVGVR
jgi:hypothetical protein